MWVIPISCGAMINFQFGCLLAIEAISCSSDGQVLPATNTGVSPQNCWIVLSVFGLAAFSTTRSNRVSPLKVAFCMFMLFKSAILSSF
ncbi:hypothetical protein D3C87_1790710 [compost metagenome]